MFWRRRPIFFRMFLIESEGSLCSHPCVPTQQEFDDPRVNVPLLDHNGTHVLQPYTRTSRLHRLGANPSSRSRRLTVRQLFLPLAHVSPASPPSPLVLHNFPCTHQPGSGLYALANGAPTPTCVKQANLNPLSHFPLAFLPISAPTNRIAISGSGENKRTIGQPKVN